MKFCLPDIGEGIKDVTITDLLVKEQQNVKKNDTVLIIESDKASMEIPIAYDCIIGQIFVKNGDKVSPGDPILQIKEDTKPTSNDNTDIPTDINYDDIKQKVETKNEEEKLKNKNIIYASPSVRKLARQLDCDLKSIKGSGENGRILINDIHSQLNNKEIMAFL